VKLVSCFKAGIGLDLPGGQSQEVIFGEVGRAIAEASGLGDEAAAALREAFLEREAAGTTAFGFGVAIPHVFHPDLSGVIVAAVRLERGIEMGAMDGVETRFLICVAAPEQERELYLSLLQHVAHTVRDRRYRSFIEQSPSAAGILDVLVEARDV